MADTRHQIKEEPTRILHVDDDLSMRGITRLVLTELDANLVVDFASDVNEAFCKTLRKLLKRITSKRKKHARHEKRVLNIQKTQREIHCYPWRRCNKRLSRHSVRGHRCLKKVLYISTGLLSNLAP